MSGEVRIRFAADADWETYRDLRLAMLLEVPDAFWRTHGDMAGWTEHQWRALAAAGTTVLAGDAGGRAVGTLGMVDNHDTLQLIAVYVVPDERGTGVGEALLHFAVREARHRGFARLVLDVTSNNQPAIGLYRRAGFVFTGATAPHPRRHDLVEREMELRLDAPTG